MIIRREHERIAERTDQHPGVLLKEHVLPALKLSVSQAARDLQITRQSLHRILAGAAAITPDMAVRLERLCGIPSLFWMGLQLRCEIQRLGTTQAELHSRIPSRTLPQDVLKAIGLDDGH